MIDPKKFVIHTTAPEKFPVRDRITLTLSVLRQARQSFLLVTGAAKAVVVKAMLGAPSKDSSRWPMHRIFEQGRIMVISDFARESW